jgi:hypothetical protein
MTTERSVRELTTSEIDVVAGGHPALVIPFAVGFALGFIGVCAFEDIELGDYPTGPKNVG